MIVRELCLTSLALASLLGCGRVDYDGSDGATADVDAGPPRTYCQQLGSDWGYNYCRDFDRTDEPFVFGWDAQTVDPRGEMRADPNGYSAPNAFLAAVTDPGDGTCANAHADANVRGAIDHTGLVFQLRMGSMDDTVPFAGAFMKLRLMDEADVEECALVIYGDGASGGVMEHVGGAAIDHPFTVRFPLEFEWTRVALSVDHVAQTFDMTVNGDTVFSGTQDLSPACTLSGYVVVSSGIQCAAELPVASGEVRLDDVHIGYNPR